MIYNDKAMDVACEHDAGVHLVHVHMVARPQIIRPDLFTPVHPSGKQLNINDILSEHSCSPIYGTVLPGVCGARTGGENTPPFRGGCSHPAQHAPNTRRCSGAGQCGMCDGFFCQGFACQFHRAFSLFLVLAGKGTGSTCIVTPRHSGSGCPQAADRYCLATGVARSIELALCGDVWRPSQFGRDDASNGAYRLAAPHHLPRPWLSRVNTAWQIIAGPSWASLRGYICTPLIWSVLNFGGAGLFIGVVDVAAFVGGLARAPPGRCGLDPFPDDPTQKRKMNDRPQNETRTTPERCLQNAGCCYHRLSGRACA